MNFILQAKSRTNAAWLAKVKARKAALAVKAGKKAKRVTVVATPDPEIHPDNEWLWIAFVWFLDRRQHSSEIPNATLTTEMRAYVEGHQIGPFWEQIFYAVIGHLDTVWLNNWWQEENHRREQRQKEIDRDTKKR